MKINEILTESLSRIVYHYTNITSALKILSSGFFQLSSSVGSIEQQYAPKGKTYFLSTTRTRHGGYHDTIGNQAVLFELDGDWFNRHYISHSVDYWENRDPAKVSHRSHEAEDRVFSKSPTIPINGVISVHVYINPNADPEVRAWGRQVLIAAKKQGIAAYFYTDKQAWRNFDSRKKGDIAILTGQDRPISSVSRHKGYLLPWVELLQAKDKSQLSKKADSLRYSLMYTYDKQSAVGGLKNELSNARKPNSGPDRAHAVKIINFMQQNNLATVEDLVDALAKKWQTNKDKLSENEVYSIKDFNLKEFENFSSLSKYMMRSKDNKRGTTNFWPSRYESYFLDQTVLSESTELTKLKKQADNFNKNLHELDQREQVDIKVGNQFSVLYSLISLDIKEIELGGFVKPKTISYIGVGSNGKIDFLEFDDGSQFPEKAELTSIGGKNITTTAFFPNEQSAGKAFTHLWMLISQLESTGWTANIAVTKV